MASAMELAVSVAGISAVTLLGWWLSMRWSWGRRLGMTMLVLLLGTAIRNLSGWKPDAAVSGWVSGPLTSLAIAELLLAIKLKTVLPRSKQLLPLFGIALLATLGGVLVGAVLLAGPLGEQRSTLAGLYTATFSGGTLNFVSVARSLSPSPSLLALATAADQIVFTLWFGVSLWLGRRQRPLSTGDPSAEGIPDPAEMSAAGESSAGGFAPGWPKALVWGLSAVITSELVSRALAAIGLGIPAILVLTSIALLMAQLPGAESRRSSYGLGLLLIQPFFVVIGLGTPLAGVLAEGRWILTYAAIVVGMHALAVLVMHRRHHLPLPELLVASQAAIGGPSTALALATGIERNELAVAGVALGLLGYVIGTYVGVAVAIWVV